MYIIMQIEIIYSSLKKKKNHIQYTNKSYVYIYTANSNLLWSGF